MLNVNPLSANFTKWLNKPKKFVGKLHVFDYFVGLVLKGLRVTWEMLDTSIYKLPGSKFSNLPFALPSFTFVTTVTKHCAI